jgi:galacturan 1,4-alpha-galacturonidase
MRSLLSVMTLCGLVPGLLALPANSDFHVEHSLEKRSARTAAPKGCLSVGSGSTYSTIASAVKALGSSKNDACIFIKSGTYKEQLTIDYAGALTFYGETIDTSSYKSNKVLITHGISSPAAGSLDASSTINIRVPNFKVYNINVENSFGNGAQAVAVTANADKLGFYGCSFLGYQDTLYVKTGTQYYSNCLIKGAVDYIFGDASAWFESCTIMSNGPGAITASSRTASDESTWYVFNNANVVSDGTNIVGKVFLGRPWRVNARVMFQKSQLSGIINAAGWTEMADGATPKYYEYKNTGDGSNTSKRKWTINATGAISINTVLGDSYSSWVNQSGVGMTASTASTLVAKTKSVASAKSSATKGSICTPIAGNSVSKDDTPAIYATIQKCGNGGTIIIPTGKTYYLNTFLNFDGCKSCVLQLDGTLKASDDLTYWGGKTAILYLKDIPGLTITGTGVIDGNGQKAWDRFASDSSYRRPTLFYIDGGHDINMHGWKMINPPNVFHSVKGDAFNIAYSNLNMSAISTSKNPPKNTDGKLPTLISVRNPTNQDLGFDIGASAFVTLIDIRVVNGDDCVAFKPGANHTTITGITCTGSHGLSVGSLGKSNADTVSNIYVSDATMISSTKAVGIKTYPIGNGHGVSTVTNVTFNNIRVQNSDYAIQIQSCYGEDESYCKTNGNNAVLKGIVFEGISGTTSNRYSPVTSNLNCGVKGVCDVKIKGYTVKAGGGTGEVLCANTPGSLGVGCAKGASG